MWFGQGVKGLEHAVERCWAFWSVEKECFLARFDGFWFFVLENSRCVGVSWLSEVNCHSNDQGQVSKQFMVAKVKTHTSCNILTELYIVIRRGTRDFQW